MSIAVIVGPPIGVYYTSYPTGVTNSVDITRRISSLTFSNSDPGGFEIASITVSKLLRGIRPNADVRVMIGAEIAWHGRINAIGEDDTGSHAQYTIECVGYGAVLSDTEMSMVYVDRDLSRWRGAGAGRQFNMNSLGWDVTSPTAMHDTSDGFPSLKMALQGPWSRTFYCEAWYDAGAPNRIGTVYFSAQQNGNVSLGDGNWQLALFGADKDGQSGNNFITNILDAMPGSPSTITPNNTYRVLSTFQQFVLWQFAYSIAAGSATEYAMLLANLAVYGDHAMAQRGTAPGGYYPSDIALHALRQTYNPTHSILTIPQPVTPDSASWSIHIGTDPLAYIVSHSAYYDPVPRKDIIDDMAKIQGWHWGVWEPQGITDYIPSFWFCARPANSTCTIRRGAVSELQAPKLQLDQLYDQCRVKYADPAGGSGMVSVTVANPFLGEARMNSGRELVADLGIGSSGAATTYGTMLLNLAIASARGSGSAIMPGRVRMISGEARPSALLRAGRDRVRIEDLPDAGPLDVVDTRRFDTFNVRRVESTLQSDGTLQTRIEFDGGADLMEVLTARLSIASVLAGV